MNHLFDGSLGQDQRFGDGGIVLPLGHLAKHIALARRELVERRVSAACVLRDERIDDLGIDHRAAICNGPDRCDELLHILHPLLEEVGPARAPPVEERERVARGRVLAEDDDPDPWVRLAQPLGRLDALVGVPGRHPDVGDDDVGPLCVYGAEERVEVLADGGDLELGLRLEQPAHPFANEVVVVRQHDPDRHS